jgi:SpoVK/Ycf46/Vps4 family AAA+-type ATPase
MNKDFLCYVAASYPILWVDTNEYDRAIMDLSKTVQKLDHTCYKWDVLSGISQIDKKEPKKETSIEESNNDPDQPLTHILKSGKKNIIFIQDYHLYLNQERLWRKLLNNINNLKKNANIIVIVSPIVEIPNEINRYVTVMDFQLPDKKRLKELLFEVYDDMKVKPEDQASEEDVIRPTESEEEEIINCGLGLTEFEFENSLYLSIAKTGKILPSAVYQQKEQLVRKVSTLDICKFEGGYETIEGMDNMKYFTKKNAGKGGKGILILGVPGGGKSHFAKATGKETNRITISLDIGNLQGGIVGETERKTKEALKIIDTMEPCILFVDEIEKGLAGVSGYNGDSGTSQRQGGQILKWLSDHTSDVYVIATANDISKLPAAFLRAERWDAIFFVDTPNEVERNAILELYKKQYKIEDIDYPNMDNWTGAEVKTMCKLAANMKISLKEAAEYVCPIYKTMDREITGLREFAKTRTVPASKPLIKEETVEESGDEVKRMVSIAKAI